MTTSRVVLAWVLCLAGSVVAGDSVPSVANVLKPDWVTPVSDGNNSVDDFRKAAVDAAGNTYITAYASSPGDPPILGALIARVDPNGVLVWQKTHNTDAYRESPFDVGTDAAGNVYMCTEAGPLAVVIKFDSAGNELFIARTGNEDNSRRPVAFHVMADGRTFQVVRHNTVLESESGFSLVCISADGATVFTTKLPDSTRTQFPNMACDNAGNAYVAYDRLEKPYMVVSFDPAGAVRWSQEYPNFAGVGSDGTFVYLNTTIDGQGRLLKLDAATGTQLAEYIGPGLSIGSYDAAGNLYCVHTGFVRGLTFYKLDSNLNVLWSYRYCGPLNSDKANGMLTDLAGNVYCGITSFFGIGARDYITVMLNSDGLPLAVGRERVSTLFTASMGRDANGTIRVAGSYQLPISDEKDALVPGFVAIKYSGVTAPATGTLQFKAPRKVAYGKLKTSDLGNANKSKVLKLKNKSKTEPVILTLSSSGAPFHAAGSHLILPGEKYSLETRFVPLVHGDFTGTITFGSSDPAFKSGTASTTGSAAPFR